jgi:serine/threonine protein kinase
MNISYRASLIEIKSLDSSPDSILTENRYVALSPGTNIVGRGWLGINDRRISRQHADLYFHKETGNVTVVALGTNPLVVTSRRQAESGDDGGGESRAEAKIYTRKLRRSQTCQLHDGDYLSLLENLYTFLVRIERVQNTEPSTTLSTEEEATQKLDSQPLARDVVAVASLPEAWPEADTHDERETTAIPLPVSETAECSSTQSAQQEQRKRKGMPTAESQVHEPTAKQPKRDRDKNVPWSTSPAASSSSGLRREDSFTQGALRIDPNDLEIVQRIGFGSCGEVMVAHWIKTHTYVAVKKIFRTLLHDSVMNEFKAEANILKKLRHPNVVLLLGVCQEGNEMCIVTEYMPRGSLRDVLNTTEKIDWNLLVKMATEAAIGMNYLHTFEPPIIHRDLKSHNLLVDDNFHVKVTDFGLAKFHSEDISMTFCGTLPWTAPEVFRGCGYTTKADVFSFGIVLWELWTRKEPYQGLSKPEIILGVAKEGLRPPLPTTFPVSSTADTTNTTSAVSLTESQKEYLALMQACWADDPSLRPSFGEIVERLRHIATLSQHLTAVENGSGATEHRHDYRLSVSPQCLTAQLRQQRAILTHTWEIDGAELEFEKEVAETPTVTMYRGRYRGQEVAIKVWKDSFDGRHISEFDHELSIMSALRSPQVVTFYGVVTQPLLCLVTEYLPNGSLYDLMAKAVNFKFDWSVVITLALETARAVNVLHMWKPPIVHRDLKSANLYVDKAWCVKVADFALARFEQPNNQSTLTKLRGTYLYAAPETYLGQVYTPASDVYSYGIILWELVTRCITGQYHRPYSEYPNLKFDFQIIIQTAHSGLRPKIPSSCPPFFAELMTKCWDADPSKRPTFAQVIEQLEHIKKQFIENKRKKQFNTSNNDIENNIMDKWETKDPGSNISNSSQNIENLTNNNNCNDKNYSNNNNNKQL